MSRIISPENLYSKISEFLFLFNHMHEFLHFYLFIYLFFPGFTIINDENSTTPNKEKKTLQHAPLPVWFLSFFLANSC
jgi:uncharacterized membrane protein